MLRPSDDKLYSTFGRNLSVNLAHNQSVFLQLAQLVGQHARCDVGDVTANFTEAQRTGEQVKENDRLPFPVDQADRRSTEQPGEQSKREWRALAMTVSFPILWAVFVRIDNHG